MGWSAYNEKSSAQRHAAWRREECAIAAEASPTRISFTCRPPSHTPDVQDDISGVVVFELVY